MFQVAIDGFQQLEENCLQQVTNQGSTLDVVIYLFVVEVEFGGVCCAVVSGARQGCPGS